MKKLALIPLLFATVAFGQGVRIDVPLQTYGPNVPTSGGPQPQALWIANATVTLCSHPSATLGACQGSPVTTYTDASLGTPCPTNAQLVQLPGTTCTAKSGTAGNIGFWYSGGLIDYWVQGPYGTYGPFSITGGGGGGGGGSPFPPSFTVQAANSPLTGFVSDPGISLNTSTHTLKTANQLTPGNVALGSTCTSAAGTFFPTVGCHLFNYIPTAPYGGQWGNFANGLVLAQQENTSASTGGSDNFFGFESAYNAASGGQYTFDGSTGVKTGYNHLMLANQWSTLGSFNGITNNSYEFGSGDGIPYYSLMTQYGNYVSSGDETGVGIANIIQQGSPNPSIATGGIWTAPITSISGNVVTYNPAMTGLGNLLGVDYQAGEGRFIRDLGSKYATGTYTLGSCALIAGAGSRNQCTLVGSGTSWSTFGVATHTTYSSTNVGAPITSNNLVICPVSGANDGLDFCVPVVSIADNTHLTVSIYPNGGWNAPLNSTTADTYAIYKSAWPTNINKVNHTFTAPDVTGLTNGHNIDQVVGYSGGISNALEIAMMQHIGESYFGNGVNVFNFSSSTAPPFNNAYLVAGAYLNVIGTDASTVGPVNFHTSNMNYTGSLFRLQAGGASDQLLFQYSDSSNAFWNAMTIRKNTANSIQGLCFYNNGLCATTDNAVVMQNGPVQMDGRGNINANQSISTTVGGIGQYQNIILDSQFQTAFGTYWFDTYCDTPSLPTVTLNTGDVLDPFGTNTAVKVVTQPTQSNPGGCGAVKNGLTQNVNLTAGHTYTVNMQLQAAAANTTASVSFAGIGSGTTTSNLATTWTNYSTTVVAPSTAAVTVILAIYTGSATVYVGPTQVCDLTVGGCLYAQTTSSAQALGYGQVLKGEIVNLASSGLSGMNPAQVAIAGSAATITSSIPLGSSANNIPRLDGSAKLLSSEIPNNAADTTGTATKATNIAGGILGTMWYQSAADTTAAVTPNATVSILCLTQQGTGTVGAAPVWGACSGSTATAWVAITAGTNLGQALVLGAGSSMETTGGGINDANEVNGAALPTSKTIVGTDGSGKIIDATGATLTNPTSGNAATATALAASPTNCSAGAAPRGINASGTAQNCTTYVQTICSGTIVLNTTAIPLGGTFDNTAACSGLLTTDNVQIDFASNPVAVTGYGVAGNILTIYKYPAANTIHVVQGNNANNSGTITPGAMTVNYHVFR